jgi:translation initiation factor 5A
MAFKVVDAIELRDGGFILIEGEAYLIKNLEVSKTGKHGHSKCRFDALSIVDGKKKVIVVPGHERYEVPLIEKKKGQVLSIAGDKASLMDLDSFENFELSIPEDMKAELKDGQTVEYWDVEGRKIIKKAM